jgi:dTDP-4-dehydrorhamnose 3,5-epimerase
MNDSEIIIIGANGQLGRALQTKYPNARAVDADVLDITDKQALENYDWSNIKTILNAAAYTNVDGAESSEGRVAAWKVNAVAPGLLAAIAGNNGINLLHISTDYVFDGTKKEHSETEDFSPLSAYGSSKAAGDISVSLLRSNYYILRTSWVIGDGKNFVRTMLELGHKGVNPTVVSDQIGRLTFTSELERTIDHLIVSKPESGTYNISNDGEPVSWADITRKIYEIAGLDNTVTNISTEEYYKGKDGIAPRPLQSSLNLGKLKATGFTPSDWVSELTKYIGEEQKK